MTNAQYATHLLRLIAGKDLHFKNMQEDGTAFAGCFGFECPEGHRMYEDGNCHTCPYHNFWDMEVEEDTD